MRKRILPALVINGVKFRPARIEWEDAWKAMRVPAAAVLNSVHGPTLHSFAYVATVGKYLVVCHEWNPLSGAGDFTVVPAAPRIDVSWI